MKLFRTNSLNPVKPASLFLLGALIFLSPKVGATPVFQEQALRALTPLELAIERQKIKLGSAEVEERRDALMTLGAMRRAEAARVALTALSDPLPIVQATAANALAALPAAESVPALVPLLNDKDEFLRQQVSYALGATHSRAAVGPLVERLTADKMDSVRAAAAVALGEIADESAVIALAEILSHQGPAGAKGKRKPEKNEFILRAAAHSLGEIGSRAAVPVLIETLSNHKRADDIRREAAQALGMIGDPAALPVLQAALGEPDVYLSRVAAEALRLIAARKNS